MNRKAMEKICAVIVGICAIVLIFGFAEMMFSALSTDYAVSVTSTDGMMKKLMMLGKWTMLSLCFIIFADAVISILNYFSKNKVLCFVVGSMYIFTALASVAFIIAIYLYMKPNDMSSLFTSASVYCEQYLTVAVASSILGAYYMVCAVKALQNKDTAENLCGTDGGNE